MRRIRMTVRYAGTDFAGSQIQPARRNRAGVLLPPARTVSGTLTTGLEALLGAPVKLLWASRTDSGVHAEGNICAFDCVPPQFPLGTLSVLLNRSLPQDVRVCGIDLAPADWHPRFSAVAREYVYRVWLGKIPPYDRLLYTAPHTAEWRDEAVQTAAALLVGRYDFAAFAKHAPKLESTLCDLQALDVQRVDGEVRLRLQANRFLHHMVCSIAGDLMSVGAGKLEPRDVLAKLAGQPSFKTVKAPARGLVLMQVIYPPAMPGPAA